MTPEERELRIKKRAHEIWVARGQPEGRDKEHWQQAASEIDKENMNSPVETRPQERPAPNIGEYASAQK